MTMCRHAVVIASVCVLPLLLCGCILLGPPRSVTHPEGVRIERDIPFATVAERILRLDLYTPEHRQEALPAVLWIHGGGWVIGSRANPPIAPLATRGYVVAAIEYRLADGDTPFPAQLHDCKAAVRFLRANAERLGIDPQRIGVWGISAGGHLATLLGLVHDDPALEGTVGTTGVSSAVACVVAFSPPVELDSLYSGTGSWRMCYAIRGLLGGTPLEKPELARQASPLTYAGTGAAPLLLIHGSADDLVPVEQSLRLDEALDQAGVPCAFHILTGKGHGNKLVAEREAQDLANAFLDEHLKH